MVQTMVFVMTTMVITRLFIYISDVAFGQVNKTRYVFLCSLPINWWCVGSHPDYLYIIFANMIFDLDIISISDNKRLTSWNF